MSRTHNNNWYNANSFQRYPLDDGATGNDDTGIELRDNILLDLHLRFPSTIGQFAFVGGMTVSDQLVTIVFLAADSQTTTDGFVPLAAVSLRKPIIAGRHYAVEPMYPGVGGWVVIDDSVNRNGDNFAGRYSTPQQTLILQRCARPYRSLPVSGLGKLLKDQVLSGLVTLKAGADLEVVKEVVSIEGRDRDAIVIRLAPNSAERNLLSIYTGPCDGRPESNNCDRPGIRSINTVTPDCNGNIDIQFIGDIIHASPFQDCAGIVVDYDLGLADVCAAARPAPVAPNDACEDDPVEPPIESSIIIESSVTWPDEEGGETEPLMLPFTENFADGDADDFTVISGTWGMTEQLSPTYDSSAISVGLESTIFAYTASNAATTNVAIWHPELSEGDSLNKRVITKLELTGTNPKRNGGIVLNYQMVDPLIDPHIEYFLATLDHNSSNFKLLRWVGTGFITEYSSSPFELILGHEYAMVVTTQPLGEGVLINIKVYTAPDFVLENEEDFPESPLFQTSIQTNQYLPATGWFGVGTNQAETHFSYFHVDELP